MSCHTGGLVIAQNDVLQDQWHDLCATATMHGQCTHKPKIFMRVAGQVNKTAGRILGSSTHLPQLPAVTKDQGYVSCFGFWGTGRDTIFNMHVTDTNANSYKTLAGTKVLAQQEKETKYKYLQSCLEMRKDFTPMVYSVNGVAGCKAQSAKKRLASLLGVKLRQEYPQMVFYVRARMQLALVRATSLLIHGSRNHRRPYCPFISDGSALRDWQKIRER